MTASAKVCVASGLAGFGAAGIVAAGLTFATAGPAMPESAPDPSSASAPGAAADQPTDPGFLLDPGGEIVAADPAVLLDPGEMLGETDPDASFDPSAGLGEADPAGPFDPGETLGSADPAASFDPDATDDPADSRNRADPGDPPAKVPEPSSIAALGVGLLGWPILRRPARPAGGND